MEGFFWNDNCYHFEGWLALGCPGRCTSWKNCVENLPEKECGKARAAKANQDKEDSDLNDEESAELDNGFSMGMVIGIIAAIVCCGIICICASRDRGSYDAPNKDR